MSTKSAYRVTFLRFVRQELATTVAASTKTQAFNEALKIAHDEQAWAASDVSRLGGGISKVEKIR